MTLRKKQSPPSLLLRTLRREKYQMVGAYAAVKKCHWMHQALVHNRFCYKGKFYGIQSHRCLQLTPSAVHCTQRCRFCWRVQPDDLGISWDESRMNAWDDPKQIVEEAINAQLRILTGYKAHSRVDRSRYMEALDPKHAAISLAGEPTLYPQLSDLIGEFHGRGMTTFLVTNGTTPEALKSLANEPSQLYVSLCAPDKESYEHLCRPQIPNAWEKLNESLKLLSTFRCPTAIRITLVKDYNLKGFKKYAKLIKESDCTYVEAKAFMHIGFSKRRLTYANMPTYADVWTFAEEISRLTGYRILDEAIDSRVVLLSRLKKSIRFS